MKAILIKRRQLGQEMTHSQIVFIGSVGQQPQITVNHARTLQNVFSHKITFFTAIQNRYESSRNTEHLKNWNGLFITKSECRSAFSLGKN
jgi:hypothetical protein